MGVNYGQSGSNNNSSSHPQMTPQQMLALYQQAIPSTLGTATAQATPTATALANSAAAANPIYTQSGLDQLQTLAPGYQQAGANLSTQQAGSNTSLINGAGGQEATAAANLSNTLNPAQAASNTQATNLVNSINLGGLSGGEQSAVERSLNQTNTATGNLGLDNATTAVSNAMNFGNALQAKRTALGSALGAASGVAQNQNSFVNPVGTATGTANGGTNTNFGLGTFAPGQANSTITSPLTFSTALGSQLAGQSVAPISQGSGNSSSQNAGAQGCFLTTACCEFMGLPDDCEELTVLRKFREDFVKKHYPLMIEEYKEIAPAIVKKIKYDSDKLRYVFNVITACVNDIKNKHEVAALHRYAAMVLKLKAL